MARTIVIENSSEAPGDYRLRRILNRWNNQGQLTTTVNITIDHERTEMIVSHPQNTIAIRVGCHIFYGSHFEAFKGRRIALESGSCYTVDNPAGIPW